MRSLCKTGLFILLPVAAGFASAANAQEPAAEAAAGPEAGVTYLGEITVEGTRAVTATKTDTPLIETPQAVSVIPAEKIRDRGALTAQETLRYSAGVTPEQFGLDTRNDQPVVRGFELGQYQDGLVKVVGLNLVPRTDVFTLDRVELLRGPSSALYGQGPAGGVFNMISKRPEFDTFGEVGVQYGSYNRFQTQVDVNRVLDEEGKWAGRFVGVWRDSEMETNEISDDRMLFMPSLSWRPTSETTITFLGLYQEDNTASSQQFLPVVATLKAEENGLPRLSSSTFLGEPDYDRLDSKQTAATLLVTHELTPGMTFNSATRYVRASVDFREIFPDVYSNPADPFIDPDNQVLNRSAYAISSDIDIWTTDNNFTYKAKTGGVKHTFLAGADYQMSDLTSRSGFGAVAPINAYDPVYGNFTPPALAELPRQKQSQFGFYAQDQMQYDRLTLVLGARHDRAENEVEGSPEQVDTATTYRAGVMYDIGYGISPYASYSESFQPVVGLDFYGVPFKPREGEQYEAGVKWEPREGTLVTLAAYQLTDTNILTNDPNNVLNSIQTGEVEGKGVELEIVHEVPGDILLTAAFSQSETEVTESGFAFELGNQLSNTPKTLASAWAVKTFELADRFYLRAGAGVRYVGETTSYGVAGTLDTPDFTLADALIGVDYQDWSLSVSATNVFDKQYYTSCRTFGDCFTGNGRNVVATLSHYF